MGVAVPGGLTTLTLGIEAELCEDLRETWRKRSLALDIVRNMFNELCRICVLIKPIAHSSSWDIRNS
jgi:hypothetical protein